MPNPTEQPPRPARRSQREVFHIWELMLLVMGVGIALTATRSVWSLNYDPHGDPITIVPLVVRILVAVLAGLSFMAVPLLLARWTRRRTPWQPGKIAWFSQGAATWLLWPPIVVQQVRGASGDPPWSGVCWLWGTPLMGLYITCALLAGGWFGRRGRRRARRSWREQFGLILSCLWACTGLYLLGLLYWIDLVKKP